MTASVRINTSRTYPARAFAALGVAASLTEYHSTRITFPFTVGAHPSGMIDSTLRHTFRAEIRLTRSTQYRTPAARHRSTLAPVSTFITDTAATIRAVTV